MGSVVFKHLIFWRVVVIFLAIFIIDQWLKLKILEGFRWDSEMLSIVLTINRGVSFSMFASLGEYLKYMQIALLGVMAFYLARNKPFFISHYLPLGIALSAGVSNITDRFLHGGVVDYIFWHYGFEFAVFNFADMMINLAVIIFVWQSYFKRK